MNLHGQLAQPQRAPVLPYIPVGIEMGTLGTWASAQIPTGGAGQLLSTGFAPSSTGIVVNAVMSGVGNYCNVIATDIVSVAPNYCGVITAQGLRPGNDYFGSFPVPHYAALGSNAVVHEPAPNTESIEMSWLVQNAGELARYKGEWLLIQGQQLLVHAGDFAAVRAAVRQLQITSPFVYYVPTDEEANAVTI